MDIQQFKNEPIWGPDEKPGERMMTLIKSIEKKYNTKFSDYWEFHKWTVDNIPKFWEEIWNSYGIIHSEPYKQIIDLNIPLENSPKWFEGAKLNIAENLLKYRDDHVALKLADELQGSHDLTYAELYDETKKYAAALRKFGLKKGDRVACYMPNRQECMIAMLATTSIGAIWTGALPTLGPKAYISRLKQVEPKILFTVDSTMYRRTEINMLENVKEISKGLPSLEKVIIVPSSRHSLLTDISDIKNGIFLPHFLDMAYDVSGEIPTLEFEQVSFSHPVFINYTSGTTGIPKTIVHGCGGLLASIRDIIIHWDCQRDDIWLTMSPVGWVSWNAISYLLFAGTTLLLFDGDPFFKNPHYNFWDMVDKHKITRLFISPSVLDQMETNNYLPTVKHDLSNLKFVMTSGGVVKPNNYNFAMKMKKDIRLRIAHGSTEMMGFCILTEPTLPTFVGEMSSPSLGTAIECRDDEGNSVLGEMGEFLITKPVPSLPLGFWGDTDDVLYKKSYFSKFSGCFAIGDAIVINPITKGIMVCGRSDETIKQRGCRFGSSEIYNVVKMFPEVQDSLCVGQQNKDGDERAVLFLLMKEGYSLDEKLVQKIHKSISEELTVRHVPDVIIETPGIPYNANGKKTELIVKKIINNKPHNPESVQNVECLEFYSTVASKFSMS